jgi:hypothetical protein
MLIQAGNQADGGSANKASALRRRVASIRHLAISARNLFTSRRSFSFIDPDNPGCAIAATSCVTILRRFDADRAGQYVAIDPLAELTATFAVRHQSAFRSGVSRTITRARPDARFAHICAAARSPQNAFTDTSGAFSKQNISSTMDGPSRFASKFIGRGP